MGAAFNFPALGMTTTIVEGNFILVDDPRTGKPIKIKVEDFLGSAADRGLLTQPVETTPDTIVEFDQLTPTTGGVVFTPNTPATESILYVSTVDASTWIYEGGTYITKTYVSSSNTPFYLTGTTIDAGGNKTASIQHLGQIRATSFTGSGGNITSLNATNLATGTVNTARLGSGAVGSGDKYLADNNTWKTVSSGGIFGISNSSGIYTYYSTLTLAMTAATSGQTIEMFADYTETGAVSITLKDNVNINGNGHTYICTASAGINLFSSSVGSMSILNLTAIATNADGSTSVFYTAIGSTGKINLTGSIAKTNAGYGARAWAGLIEGLTSIVTGTANALLSQGGTFLNCKGYSASNYAIDVNIGYAYNCYGESSGSSGIYGGIIVSGCYGIGNTAGIIAYGGTVANSVGFSSIGYGIQNLGSNMYNCTAISTASWGLFLYSNNVSVYNCTIISTANNAFYTQFVTGTTISNCTIKSSTALTVKIVSMTTKMYNNTIICTWNNSAGYNVWADTSGNSLAGNTLEVTNASANCIYSAGAITCKYANSNFIGSTTPVNANITQAITNTQDNQGNITVN